MLHWPAFAELRSACYIGRATSAVLHRVLLGGRERLGQIDVVVLLQLDELGGEAERGLDDFRRGRQLRLARKRLGALGVLGHAIVERLDRLHVVLLRVLDGGEDFGLRLGDEFGIVRHASLVSFATAWSTLLSIPSTSGGCQARSTKPR